MFKEENPHSERRFPTNTFEYSFLWFVRKNSVTMNAKKTNKLQRMIIITPEIFEKIRPLLHLTNIQNSLDSEMFNVLKIKNLNSIDKWYRYRQVLHRQAELNRRSRIEPDKIPKAEKQKYHSQIGTQTKMIFKEDQSTSMTPKKNTGSKTPTGDQTLLGQF